MFTNGQLFQIIIFFLVGKRNLIKNTNTDEILDFTQISSQGGNERVKIFSAYSNTKEKKLSFHVF